MTGRGGKREPREGRRQGKGRRRGERGREEEIGETGRKREWGGDEIGNDRGRGGQG